MAQYAREPRAYELMAILLPELADEDLTAAIDRVSTHLTDVNAEIREILKDSPWGRRRLAYTIRFNGQDYRDGFYIIWHFAAEPSQLSDLERELKLDTRVMRYLLVLEDPKWNSPQEREAAHEIANAPAETNEAEAPATDARPEEAEAPAEVAQAVAAAEEAEEVPEVAVEDAEEVAAVEEAGEVSEVAVEDVPAASAAAEEAPADTETVEDVPAETVAVAATEPGDAASSEDES